MFKKFKIIISLLAIAIHANAQWTQINIGPTRNLSSVDFVNANNIWIGGVDSVFFSSNGTSFTAKQGVDSIIGAPIIGKFDDIVALNGNTAIATGLFYTGGNEIIYKTISSANSWTKPFIASPPTLLDYFTDIEFSNSLRGLCVGHDGRMAGTTDAGNTWVNLASSTSTTLTCVKYTGSNIWVGCGSNVIIRSVDNGQNWTSQVLQGDFISMGFSGTTGYVAGSGGQIFKSVDSGLNWTPVTTHFTDISCIFVIDATTILVATQNDLYRSTNSGQYWQRYHLSNYQTLNDIDLTAPTIGIAVGDNGYVIKNSNLGAGFPESFFTAAATTVCAGSSIAFSNFSDPSLSCQWLLDNTQISTNYNATIVFPTSGNHNVKLVTQNSTGNDTMSVSVVVNAQATVAPFTLTNAANSVCRNGVTNVLLANSQLNVQYFLRDGFVRVGNVQYGNGNQLSFPTGALPVSTQFNIIGISQGTCGNDSEIVNTSIHVVAPSPSTTFSLSEDSICTGDSISLVVNNSESDFTYQWSAALISGFSPLVQGNGGTIAVPVTPVTSDGTYAIGVRVASQGCNELLNISLPLKVVAVPGFYPSTYTVLVNDTISFNNYSDFNTYTWNFGADANPSTFNGENAPPVRFSIAGNHTITLTAAFGNSCVRNVSHDIEVVNNATLLSATTCRQDTASGNIVVMDMELDKYNSTYIAGYYLSNSPNNDLFVAKYDSLGRTVWKYFHPNAFNNHSFGLGITSDDAGNAYFTVSTSDASFSIQNKKFEESSFIFKFDTKGNLVWKISSPTAAWTDIAMGKDGYLYTAGLNGRDSCKILFPNGDVLKKYAYPDTSNHGSGFMLSFDINGNFRSFDYFGEYYEMNNPTARVPVSFPVSFVSSYSGYRTYPRIRLSENNDLWIGGIMSATRSMQEYNFGGAILQRKVMSDSTINASEVFVLRYKPGQGFKKAFTVLGGDIELFEDFEEKDGKLFFCGGINQHAITGSQIENLIYEGTYNDHFGYLVCADTSGQSLWQHYNPWTRINDLAVSGSDLFVLGTGKTPLQFADINSTIAGVPAIGITDAGIAKYDFNGHLQGIIRSGSSGGDLAFKMESDRCGVLHTIQIWNTSIASYPLYIPCCSNSGDVRLINFATAGSCPANCFESNNFSYMDLSIDSLYLDNNLINSASPKNIYVRLRNTGVVPVTSAQLQLEVNHSSHQTINWSGNLLYTQSDSILIGNLPSSSTKEFRIKLNIASVNGASDMNALNDTASMTQLICTGPLSGIYSIGKDSVSDFETFNSSLAVLAECGISGNTVFNVKPGVYREQLRINPVNGVDINDTIVYKGVTSDSTQVQLEFNPGGSENYATINFLKNSRHFTFSNMTLINDIEWGFRNIVSHEDSADFITFHNNLFRGSNLPGQYLVVHRFSCDNEGAHFYNNHFIKGRMALALFKGLFGNGSQRDKGTIVRNNIFEDQFETAVNLKFKDAPVVEGNQFIVHNNNSGTRPFCIELSYYTGKAIIRKNNIVNYRASTLFGNISVTDMITDTMSSALISDNFVRDATSPVSLQGDYGVTVQGLNIDILNNTIGGGISIGSFCNNCRIEDNIIFAGLSVALTPNSHNTIIDHNNYWSDTTILPYPFQFGTTPMHLMQWQDSTGHDLNSTFIEPQFIAANDNHLSLQNSLSGNPHVEVVDDIDGEPRNMIHPTKGADEINGPVAIDEIQSSDIDFSYILNNGYNSLIISPVNYSEWTSFKITTSHGRIIYTGNNISPEMHVDIHSFGSGVYYLTGLKNNKTLRTKKLLIVR